MHNLFFFEYKISDTFHSTKILQPDSIKGYEAYLKYDKSGKLDDIITHRLPLTEISRGYDISKRKKMGVGKLYWPHGDSE